MEKVVQVAEPSIRNFAYVCLWVCVRTIRTHANDGLSREPELWPPQTVHLNKMQHLFASLGMNIKVCSSSLVISITSSNKAITCSHRIHFIAGTANRNEWENVCVSVVFLASASVRVVLNFVEIKWIFVLCARACTQHSRTNANNQS